MCIVAHSNVESGRIIGVSPMSSIVPLWRNLESHLKAFLAYTVFYQLDLDAIPVPNILGFIETLAVTRIASNTIRPPQISVRFPYN